MTHPTPRSPPLTVLIVDDQAQIARLLETTLGERGFRTLTARTAEEALDLYHQHRPAFTLTDIMMPGMSGLDLLRQIKASHPEAVVMIMTGAGTETHAADALRGGAVNYFCKPINLKELLDTLRRYTALAAGYDFERHAAEILQNEHIELRLTSDLNQVNRAAQLIVSRCRAIFPLDELFTLRFGLYEMIVNAIEHGNLEIGYDAKSHALEANRWEALFEERRKDAQLAARSVQVSCDLSPMGLICQIRDEGAGFDHAPYTAVRDANALFTQRGLSLHGRGIILTRLQFDEVRYTPPGNVVTLIKHPPAPSD